MKIPTLIKQFKMRHCMFKKCLPVLLIIPGFLLFNVNDGLAQQVSLAPSRLYYKVEPGESKTQTVTVTNRSNKIQSFAITFGDFEPAGYEGKSKIMNTGESENSCSEWMSASPSFFELEPGATQKVLVQLQVPSLPDANKVKWSAMKIKLTKEKDSKELQDKNAIGMGVRETFQFVVHIFQSPSSVTYKNAEITSFREINETIDGNRVLAIKVKNTGDAILDCASYLELTQLSNGNEERLRPFAFTVLPGSEREVKFQLPSKMNKGKYSILSVVDYGSRENVQAAEMELDIN